MLEKFGDVEMKKIEMVEAIRVYHPRMIEMLNLMQECHLMFGKTTNPQCLLITGGSGSGKSTLVETYLHTIGQAKAGFVLSTEIPAPTTIASLVEELLKQLGEKFSTRGTLGNKIQRLFYKLQEEKIELIILDEFQHFVNTGKQKVIYEVADWFKGLINVTKIPVILLGLGTSKTVLRENDQLNSRFETKREIYPFYYSNEETIREFQRFLFEIDQELIQILGSSSKLDDDDISERIFAVTGGSMRAVMTFIRRAARYAIKENKERIDFHDLSRAFEYGNSGTEIPNPFH